MISLYQAGMSSCSQKVRFVLEQKGLEWERIDVDLHNDENYSAEFKKLNPKAIIPVLIDDGDKILESNNICLYLDEKYTDTPLMPSTAKGRSDVRFLLQLIDEQVHSDSSVCTYAMAFRDRILNTHDTDEKLTEYLTAMPDAGRRHIKKQVIIHGTDSPEFEIAVIRLNAMVIMLEQRLNESTYLVGDELTIADIAYSPYMTRMAHLNMQNLWSNRPKISEWFARVQDSVGYQKGLVDYFSKQGISNLNAAGSKWTEKVQTILSI